MYTNGHALYVNLVPDIVLDGTPSTVNTKFMAPSDIVISIPHFSNSVGMYHYLYINCNHEKYLILFVSCGPKLFHLAR